MPQSTVPPRAPLCLARHNKQQLSPYRTSFTFFVYGTAGFFLGLALLFPELQLTSARISVPRPTRSFQGQGINMQHLAQNLNGISSSISSDTTTGMVDQFTLSSSDRPTFKRWRSVFAVRCEVDVYVYISVRVYTQTLQITNSFSAGNDSIFTTKNSGLDLKISIWFNWCQACVSSQTYSSAKRW
jgi:hypothetical protein